MNKEQQYELAIGVVDDAIGDMENNEKYLYEYLYENLNEDNDHKDIYEIIRKNVTIIVEYNEDKIFDDIKKNLNLI